MQRTQPIKSKRFTLVHKEDYKVDLEYNEHLAILHLPKVNRFTKTVYLDMLECIEDIEGFLLDLGYASLWLGIPIGDSPLAKLVKKLNFTYRGSAEGLDIYERSH